jgi:hypothetical protein
MVRPGSIGLAAIACASTLFAARRAHAAPPTAAFPVEPAPAPASAPPQPPAPGPPSAPASAPAPAPEAVPAPSSAPSPPVVDAAWEQRAKAQALRQTILRAYVRESIRRRQAAEDFGYGSIIFDGIGVGVGAVVWSQDRPLGVTYVAGYGAAIAAFGLSWLAERDTRADEVEALTTYGTGVTYLGFAVAEDPGSIPRLSTASAAGAYFTVALLQSINSLARKTRTSTLRARKNALSQPCLDEREFRITEQAFLDTDVPIRQGVMAAPLGIGAGMALIPAIDGHHTNSEATAAAIIGGLVGLSATLTALTPNLVPSYIEQVRPRALTITASPMRFDLRYRF